MTPQQIADRLHELCSQGKYEQAQRELYHEEAVSIEPEGAQGLPSTRGLQNIIAKGDQFQAMIEEMHATSMSQPLVAGNFIATSILLEATMKGLGRVTMDEICVYEVKDSKIVSEQFFYQPGA